MRPGTRATQAKVDARPAVGTASLPYTHPWQMYLLVRLFVRVGS
jgi:hypothetical protein